MHAYPKMNILCQFQWFSQINSSNWLETYGKVLAFVAEIASVQN